MHTTRRSVLAGLASGMTGAAAGANVPSASGLPSLPGGPEVIPLWPGAAPGARRALSETLRERSADPAHPDRALLDIAAPRMAVFRPTGSANGAAVLISPGGGYAWVVVDKEGFEMARWLAARGFHAFVLFYRLPGAPRGDWANPADVPLADAQRAMRLIRHRAADYGIDPARVAAMGFSAGGHVCADLAARFAAPVYAPLDAADRLPARPFCAAPIYPVVSMQAAEAHPGSRRNLLGEAPSREAEIAHSPHHHIPADPPPHFLCHAEDDPAVPLVNTLLLRASLRARGARVETHLFEQGGHGFGLRLAAGKPVAVWPDLWLAHARTLGLCA